MQKNAENLNDFEDEQPVKKPEESTNKLNASDENLLSQMTDQEKLAVQKKETSLPKLTAKREKLFKDARQKLKDLSTSTPSKEGALTLEEFKQHNDEIEKIVSPALMEKKIKELKELEKKKEEESADKERMRDPEDKELIRLQKTFDRECDENEQLIGTREKEGFKAWFKQERLKKPQIRHLEQKLEDFRGKTRRVEGGLAPRRDLYRDLTSMFKRYGLSSPLDSSYVTREGKSERQTLLNSAREAEKEINSVNENFWSKKAINAVMQDILKTDTGGADEKGTRLNGLLKDKIKKIQEIKKIESEGFSYMKDTINSGNNTVRKMSDASIGKYLSGIINEGDLKKRFNYITGNGKYKNGIKEAVENEGSLAQKTVNPEVAKQFGIKKGLEGIFENDKEGLKKAISAFQNLDFLQKIDFLKDQEELRKKNDSETLRESNTVLSDSLREIEKARSDKILSDKVAEKFRDWAKNKEKYTDEKTGKIDLKKQEKGTKR